MSDKERAVFDLNEDDDQLDISVFAKKKNSQRKPSIDPKVMLDVAEKSGFTSRQPTKKRRSRRRSPYTVQTNFKTRPGMKELIQEIGDRLDTYDQETFELAIHSLLEKNAMSDLLEKYLAITS